MEPENDAKYVKKMGELDGIGRVGGMGWARLSLPRGRGPSGVCLMNLDTAHPALPGSGRIENACGVTGGRSPRVGTGRGPFPKTSGTQ